MFNITFSKHHEELRKEAEERLTQSLKKYLSNDAKIIYNKLTVEDIGEGKIRVNLLFTVEQDIAENIM